MFSRMFPGGNKQSTQIAPLGAPPPPSQPHLQAHHEPRTSGASGAALTGFAKVPSFRPRAATTPGASEPRLTSLKAHSSPAKNGLTFNQSPGRV